MDRRRFLPTWLAGALATPLASEAQAGTVHRVGVLWLNSPPALLARADQVTE